MNFGEEKFDVVSIVDDNSQWVARLVYKGVEHNVRLEKLRELGIPFAFVVSGRDVADIFGDNLSIALSSFLGDLLGACLAGEGKLPVREIKLDEVQKCARAGESFGDLVNKIIT